MKLTSSAFDNNAEIPAKYTCDGENISPPLEISDIPPGTKSLTLILEDPDAVSKKPWIHWVLYNMSPNISFIKENEAPSNAAAALTDSGKPEYSGACPPSGSGLHHYTFKLYALDEKLKDMPEFTDRDMVDEAMQGHILGETELVGTYQK